MTTVHDLLAAYKEGTGLSVSMSYSRQMTLTDLCSRGLTPEDITELCKEMKKLISQDRKGTYTYACLDFRNLMNPDTCEERCLRLRQRKQRVIPKPEPVQRSTADGNGVLRVLDDPPREEVQKIDMKGALINLANNIKSA